MSYDAYAHYVIWFADPVEAAAAQALAGGNGWKHCPFNAATTFGITWPLVGGDTFAGTKGIYYISQGYNLSNLNHPQPSGIALLDTVDSVIVPGQASSPAATWPGNGPDLNLIWLGSIVYSAKDVGGGVPPATPIPQRRWLGGFENGGAFSDGMINYSSGGSRISSRVLGGCGFGLRGDNVAGNGWHIIKDNIPAYEPTKSWERFYFRIHKLGTNELRFWRLQVGFPTANGAVLALNTSGQLLAYSTTAATGGTLLGTSAVLNLNKWYLCDVLITLPTAAPQSATLRVYLNHVLVLNLTDSSNTGLDTVSYHAQTTMGRISAAETDWEFDLDDWMCADIPNNGGVESLDSLDWTYGSHIRLCHPLTVNFTNWAGAIQDLLGGLNPDHCENSVVVSTTALATVEAATTEVIYQDQVIPGANLGLVAILAQGNTFSGAINKTGRFGYSLAAGAYVYKNVIDSTGFLWRGNLYSQSGADPLPTDITPFKMIKEKSNDATSFTMVAFNANVEYIGLFGIEDNVDAFDFTNNNQFNHNARYPGTQYGLMPFVSPPDSPCFIVGGTFVGNDTGQDINLPSLPHFIWIRPLTGVTITGQWWHGASMGTHHGGQGDFFGNMISRVWVDSAGQPKMSISGKSKNVNANGVTFQYIAFCDPGMRFVVSEGYNIRIDATSGDIPIFDPNWIPQAGFAQREFYAADGVVIYNHYKGTGHAGNTGTKLSGTALNNWGNFSPGNTELLSDNIWADTGQESLNLWRTTDDNGYVELQITNYTGDGTGNRTITLPLVTGRYPVWAYVQPHNAVGFVRDPSHAANTSSNVTSLSTTSVSAIKGASAPDQLDVGSTLNANGVIYEVFVILGDSAGWNNGTFYPPNGISGGPWIIPTFNPPDAIFYIPTGGMDFNGTMSSLVVVNLSGIYTLVPGKITDTLYTGIGDATEVVEIPDPTFKTGYIGG